MQIFFGDEDPAGMVLVTPLDFAISYGLTVLILHLSEHVLRFLAYVALIGGHLQDMNGTT